MKSDDSNTAGPRRNATAAPAFPARSGEGADAPLPAGPGGPPDEAALLARSIKAKARDLGFAACGITTADDLPCGPLLSQWLAEGRHGDMDYLAEKHERRLSPSLVLPGARAAVVVAWSYAAPLPADPHWATLLRGRVAAYALAQDYHVHVAARLEALSSWLADRAGADCSVHVDGGPLVEKELARRAGIGWYGRNTNLLSRGLGSTFVLGTLLTTAAPAPDHPFEGNHCGTCRACIPACPTDALGDGPTIDARRCISYLTIEHRGPVPEPLRGAMGNWIFGCDLCQDPCPWNGKATLAPPLLHTPWLPGLLQMNEAGFQEAFRGTPMARPKRRGIARNAAIALGNTANPAAVPFLAAALRGHDEPLVRAHAAWALGRIGGSDAVRELERACRDDAVPPVRREAARALAPA